MKTPSKQQLILFKILQDHPAGVRLGELRVLFYKIHTPVKNFKYRHEMKRNSKMSAWLNTLSRNGLIYINRGEFYQPWNDSYSLTDKSKELINEKGF